jgi:hypothetical protein
MYGGPVSDSRKVLHKLVVVLIAVVTELNRSNIAMGYPRLTDLVFLGAYVIVRGINRPTRGQESEMSITRRAVIREGTQTRVTREIRRLEHDVAPTGVAYQVVTTSFVRSENDRA